ncbi:MAG: glucose-6-phosphate dehydrogenase [Nitrospirae bacterium]|nr:glucose-6-phosphate dehydrogenase [Nitrospirota bacterium]
METGNPVSSEEGIGHRPDPCTMVVFGVTGSLARRKLLPALYHLARRGFLPAPFSLVGVGRRPWDHEQFRREVRAAVEAHSRFLPIDEKVWAHFSSHLFFHPLRFESREDYHALGNFLADRERTAGLVHRVFYLATPPGEYGTIVGHLGETGLSRERSDAGPWTRVIVEKPFGHDLLSSRHLHAALERVFPEEAIYRIDHYLGKETVQNLLVFRFANGIFDPLWNQKYVDHVQITVAEDEGVAGRGSFFDQVGILRDIVQNHILQLLCLTAMDPPVTLEAESVRNEKLKVLRALRPILPEETREAAVRGQYQAGWIAGSRAEGYRSETGVAADSSTETYAALKVYVDNSRWAEVPFYLRAGKRLPKRTTEIAVVFKPVPRILFNVPGQVPLKPNVLAVRIQPDEGISLSISSKAPGMSSQIHPVRMDFRYGSTFGIEAPEAYERLLLDVMQGDRTLFAGREEVERAWEFITPILHGWKMAGAAAVHPYAAGTWGPAEADRLILTDRRSWRRL